MRLCNLIVCAGLALAVVVTTPALAAPDEAARYVAQATDMLARGDLTGALKAYNGAAKADPENQTCRDQIALLQRVIQMRQTFDKLEGTAAWATNAEALHVFYHDNGAFAEALALDRKVHDKLRASDSAARLARSELAMGQDAPAAELLGSLPKDQVSTEVRLLLARALGRQGKTAEARAAIADFTPPEDAPGLLFFDLACVQALTGDAEKALVTLTRSVETTSPERLGALKARAQTCPDLASVKSRPEFAKAFAAACKVSESKCSSGASCAKCPSRTSCAGEKKPASAGKDQPPEGQPKP